MKHSLLNIALYSIAFTLIIFSGKNITWSKSVSIGVCLGIFLSILSDILTAIKNK